MRCNTNFDAELAFFVFTHGFASTHSVQQVHSLLHFDCHFAVYDCERNLTCYVAAVKNPLYSTSNTEYSFNQDGQYSIDYLLDELITLVNFVCFLWLDFIEISSSMTAMCSTLS